VQLFDDLEDFGSFDDAVSGDVRDPYTELAQRRREGTVQRLDLSGMPMADDAKPIFMVYGYDEVAELLRDNETFSSSIILAVFGDVLGKKVMLGMDEPEHRRLRALLSGAFTQRVIARRQHDLVERRGEGRRDAPLLLVNGLARRGGLGVLRAGLDLVHGAPVRAISPPAGVPLGIPRAAPPTGLEKASVPAPSASSPSSSSASTCVRRSCKATEPSVRPRDARRGRGRMTPKLWGGSAIASRLRAAASDAAGESAHDIRGQASGGEQRGLHGERLDLLPGARVTVDEDRSRVRPRRLSGLAGLHLQIAARDRRGQEAERPHAVGVRLPARIVHGRMSPRGRGSERPVYVTIPGPAATTLGMALIAGMAVMM
jgi:hypothetical protein